MKKTSKKSASGQQKKTIPQVEIKKESFLFTYWKQIFGIITFLATIATLFADGSVTLNIIDNYYSKIIGKDKLFEKNDNRFKILIVPFKVHGCTEHDDIGGIIKNRLSDLNKKNSVNIVIKYLNFDINENFDEKSAMELQKHHNADFIIYGNYRKGDCLSDLRNEVCINYLADEKWILENLQNSSNVNENKLATLHDIANGKLQSKIDFIIEYVAGISLFYQRDYSNAILHFSNANQIDKNNLLNLDYLIQCNMNTLKLNEALSLIEISIFLAKKNKIPKYFSHSLFYKGVVYTMMGKTQKSLEAYFVAKENYVPNVCVEDHLYTILNNIAMTYFNEKEYVLSIKYLEESLTQELKFPNTNQLSIALTHNNLAVAYDNVGDYKKSLNNIEIALKIRKQILGKENPLYLKTIEDKKIIEFNNLSEH